MKSVTVNPEQKLFVIPCGDGFTCLGFDVLERRAIGLGRELVNLGWKCPMPAVYGTLERYAQYGAMVEWARNHNAKTGWRSASDLTPQLIGLEHSKVEVVHRFEGGAPEKVRFVVGKSSGFIPCHLMLKSRCATGGESVCLGEIVSVRKL
jgi:hypothetical protein